jgi:uncharacterized protein
LLDPAEVRVLGALIEKQIATPDYYPLTFNSLLTACNQKTARNPVTDYDEKEIMTAIDGLREKGFAVQVNIAGSRVEKYRHRMDSFAELDEKEIALLCILMLRGAQTIGELRQRTERLYPFKDLAETEESLKGLMEREDPEPLVSELPKEPGRKEKRYVHLFSDISSSIPESETVVTLPRASPSQVQEKMEALESVVEELQAEIKLLKEQFESFKQQFD